jgi:hypothetical protein
MKKIIPVLVLLLVPALLCAALFLLGEVYPFHPWHSLYPAQARSEQLRLSMIRTPEEQARWAFRLAERRLADLALAQGDEQVWLAIPAFSEALDQALNLAVEASDETQVELLDRFHVLVFQAEIVVSALEPQAGSPLLEWLKLKLAALGGAETTVEAVHLPMGLNQARAVTFVGEVAHSTFPLVGQHIQVGCLNCHKRGEYANTPHECKACHTAPAGKEFAMLFSQTSLNYTGVMELDLLVGHFQEDCSDCHTPQNWVPFKWEHKNIQQCIACHAEDTPDIANLSLRRPVSREEQITLDRFAHYPGDCGLCHTSTTSWGAVSYQHKAATDCASCHAAALPQAHYPGQCSLCHQGTQTWQDVVVDHELLPNCLTCHQDDMPLAHYRGTCSNCHNTQDWVRIQFSHKHLTLCQACHVAPEPHHPGSCKDCHVPESWIDFSPMHKGMQCESCHTAEAGHYPGGCTNCHTPSTWKTIQVNHKILPECESCHTAPRPHYYGKCSLCHTTTRWSEISFLHNTVIACEGCHAPPDKHYGMPCSTCHVTNTWDPLPFDHTLNMKCEECHSTPGDHYVGPCVSCHTWTSWLDISFNHAYYPDCSTCHKAPVGHWPGECTPCHHTTSWMDITFDHTTYTDCKACHKRPSTHQPGQCSKCHTTTTWMVLHTPTPRPTSDPATRTFTPTVTPTNTATPTFTPTETPTFTPPVEDTPEPLPTDTPEPPPPPTPTLTPSPESPPDVDPVQETPDE